MPVINWACALPVKRVFTIVVLQHVIGFVGESGREH